MKYNKILQNRLNLNFNYYKEYSQLNLHIKIALTVSDNKYKNKKLFFKSIRWISQILSYKF